MANQSDVIGKTYPAVTYAVGREKIREYARATGNRDPRHLDVGAAREAGYHDVIAPPLFCVVYAAEAVSAALLDPVVGLDFARMVHGGQQFRWGVPVQAGDEIITTASVTSIEERDGKGFFVFTSISVNGDGNTVCTGVWTNIVRGTT